MRYQNVLTLTELILGPYKVCSSFDVDGRGKSASTTGRSTDVFGGDAKQGTILYPISYPILRTLFPVYRRYPEAGYRNVIIL